MASDLVFQAKLQDRATKKLNKIIQKLNQIEGKNVRASVRVGPDTKKSEKAFKKFQQKNMKNLKKMDGKVSPIHINSKKISKDVSIVQKSLNNMKPPGKLKRGINAISKSIKSWGPTIATVVSSFTLLAGAATIVAGAIAAISLTPIIKQSIELNTQFETFTVQLRTAAGSLTAAKDIMADVVKFAKQTPYELQEVVDAVVKLRAYALDEDKWLKAAGDMAAAFGRPITNAIEAAADASLGEFRRMRNYGIRLLQEDFLEGGKHAGKTFAEATLEIMQKRFSGGMELQAKTWTGIYSNIKDTVSIALLELGEPLFRLIKERGKDLLNTLNEIKESGVLEEWADKIGLFLEKVFTKFNQIVGYIRKNLLPSFKDILVSVMEIWAVVGKVFSPLLGILVEIITAASKLVSWFYRIATAGTTMTVITTAVLALVAAYKRLGARVIITTAEVKAFGSASAAVTAKLKALIVSLGKVAALLVITHGISQWLEFNNTVEDISKNLDSISPGIDNIENSIDEMANKLGYSKNEMSDVAGEASKFGEIWKEVAFYSAEYARNIDKDAQTFTKQVGEMAEYLGAERQEIEGLTKSLAVLDEEGKKHNYTLDETIYKLKKHPELLGKIKGGYEELITTTIAVQNSGGDLNKELEEMSKLLTPSLEMLTSGEYKANTWVTGAIEDFDSLQMAIEDSTGESVVNLKKMMGAGNDMEIIISVLNQIQTRLKNVREETQELNIELTNMKDEITALDNKLKQYNIGLQEIALQERELKKEIDTVNSSMEEQKKELDRLNNMKPTGFKELDNQIFNLDMALNNLSIKETRLKLRLLGDEFKNQEKAIDEMNSEIGRMEDNLEPLKDELDDVTEEFNKVSDAIDKAQDKLDKWTNPKLKGQEEYEDKLHDIEMQETRLERKKLDVKDRLKGFERVGLTSTEAYKEASADLTVINNKLADLENQAEKVKLERKLDVGDTVYELEKMADREQEVSQETARIRQAEALQELDRLEPQLAKLEKQKTEVENRVENQQKLIDSKKEERDTMQETLDISKQIIQNELEQIENRREILTLTKDIATAQLKSLTAPFERKKEQITAPVKEGDPRQILSDIAKTQSNLENLEGKLTSLETDMSNITASFKEAGGMTREEIEDIVAEKSLEKVKLEFEAGKLEEKITELENTEKELTGYAKTITKELPKLIEKVDVSATTTSDFSERIRKTEPEKPGIIERGKAKVSDIVSNPLVTGAIGGGLYYGGGKLLGKAGRAARSGLGRVPGVGAVGRGIGGLGGWLINKLPKKIVSEGVETAGKAAAKGGMTGKAGSFLAGIPMLGKPFKGAAEAASKGEMRAATYESLDVINTLEAAKEGKVPERLIRQTGGKVSGKGLGKMGIVPEATADILGRGGGLFTPGAGEAFRPGLRKLGKVAKTVGKLGISAPADIALGSYDLQRAIRSDFMDEKVWKKVFFGKTWDEFWSSSSNPLTKVGDKIRGLMSPETFLELTDPIAAMGEAIDTLLGGVAPAAFDAILGFFTNIGAVLIGKDWDWSRITGGLEDAWEELKTFKNDVLNIFGEQWDIVEEYILGPFKAAWDWLFGESLSDWPGKMWDALESAPGKFLQEAWTVIKNNILSPFEDAWNWLKGLTDWPGDIWDYVESAPGKFLQETWTVIEDNIIDPFKNAWDWISGGEGLASWPGEIKDFMAKIPEKLGELKDSLINAGKKIVEWLIDGMSKMYDKVRDLPVIGELFKAAEKIGAAVEGGVGTLVGAGGNILDNVTNHHSGGIIGGSPSKEILTKLRGQEAVIPLQKGSVPVKILGDQNNSKPKNVKVVNNNFTEGSWQITVRNDKDLEEVKKAILQLRDGTLMFEDDTSLYPQGY